MLRWVVLTALAMMAMAIWVAMGYAEWLEQVYAPRFFPLLASWQRLFFGSLPFSLGDLLYSAAGIYLLWQLIVFVRALMQKTKDNATIFRPLLNIFSLLLFCWVYFYLCWGMNYYRLGIAYQLQIEKDTVSREALLSLNHLLVERVNDAKQRCIASGDTLLQQERIKASALTAYRRAEKKFPFLQYRHPSIKPSLFGTVGNYVGFLGYYNPFTGEAQLNVKGPQVVQPFVACHEIAHQLGYASESEANFVAFLVGAGSVDEALQYATYLDMFMYAAGNLQAADSTAAKKVVETLHPAVRADLRSYRDFYRRHRIFLTEWVDWFYDWYLRANRQEEGLSSYSEVVTWLIAYDRKYGL